MALAIGLLAVACSGSPGGMTAAPTGTGVRLVKVATLGQPLAMATRRGDPSLYIAEQTGKVVRVRDGTVDPVPVLDLSPDLSVGGEQGLLGIAFSPDGRFLYANYTNVRGDTRVVEWAMKGDAIDPGSRREVLRVHQPFSNHNGGNLVFGPDGDLYIGLGDGGSGGDPFGNGQNLGTLLGKMLRIDPRPAGTRAYSIPADNPFVDTPGARPEIWAFGLRNPWRYSFDRSTGDLWIGDVGQSSWEEIDRQRAGSAGGENYGWNRMEGDHPYDGGSPPPGYVPPVYEYSSAGAADCAVTGGYVYRGSLIPDLAGSYVFADFCEGKLMALRPGTDHPSARPLGPVLPALSSFGEDQRGELYAMSLSRGLFRLEPA